MSIVHPSPAVQTAPQVKTKPSTQSLKQMFLRWLGPNVFSGVTVSDWIRVLRENKFAVDAPYLSRAVVISMFAATNSVGAFLEDRLHGKAIANAQVRPPLFVLGCWRSGTTHLHNLFSKDDRFGFPTTYQVMNPHVFLANEWWNAPIQNLFFPARRMMDNVKLTTSQPQEDEFALAAMCGMSPMLAMSFWRQRDHYNRFTTMEDVPESDVQYWKRSLDTFFRKLTVKYDKPLVVKSPAHTARIAMLLDMYPEAKFVNVHRHPFDVFVSAVHMYSKNLPIIALQQYNLDRIGSNIVKHFAKLFEAYFEQRSLIPEGRLVEVSFDELDADAIATTRRVYEELQLPDFSEAEESVTEYVQSLASYEKNRHRTIDPKMKQKVVELWGRCFEEWGYAA